MVSQVILEVLSLYITNLMVNSMVQINLVRWEDRDLTIWFLVNMDILNLCLV